MRGIHLVARGLYFKVQASSSDRTTQCSEMILKKIAKTFNKAYSLLKSMIQRFQIHIFQNPSCKGVESTSQKVQLIRPELGKFGTAA